MNTDDRGRSPATRIRPMKAAGTQHLIERTYREGGTFQWVRETALNALEANATRIEFGIEWQAVENKGVYRRLIADNGQGMTADELVEFFNTFGGGGKPIGGAHENFGVGSKTSLLPWNHYGMVVVSWVDGEASMIWVQRDPSSGEYGLRIDEATDEGGDTVLTDVFEPYLDDEHGCDWRLIKPDWIDKHGTVVVLLGNNPADNTVMGDPNRDEASIKGISAYLNKRFWEFDNGAEIVVEELRHEDRGLWPSDKEMASTIPPQGRTDRRTNRRTIQGARYFIDYPRQTFSEGKLSSSGSVNLDDGTEVRWYLWRGERPAVHMYAARYGYIAALYRNELYDIQDHQASFRTFGVTEAEVRRRLWLILCPRELRDGKFGVYPRTDRNSLLLKGGPNAGGPLPFSDWGAEFAENMPRAIVDAIGEARGGKDGTLTDDQWRERLAERFGSRWRLAKLRATPTGAETVSVTQAGSDSRRRAAKRKSRAPGGGQGGMIGSAVLGSQSGSKPAARTTVSGGIPVFRLVRKDDMSDPGYLAAWQPNDPKHPEGAVLINVDHTVLRAEVEHWQAQYPDHLAKEIGDEVLHTYGQIAVAKVAHSEHLRGMLPPQVVTEDMRSEAALTMALLGLIAEESVIAPKIGGKYRRKRSAA